MNLTSLLSFFGGIGLFLYGMSIMSTGLKNAAGDKLRTILEKVAGKRITAVLIGILVTMLIQSSSATDMMVIGFVDSALMNLSQAIGVIMGANIGTTVTAQITAFNLTAYAPFLLFVGCVMALFAKSSLVQNIGKVILGFGMLFVGIGILKSAIALLAESDGFVKALGLIGHPAAAILFGILFTALLQSSSSSIVIFQAFAVEGMLSYEQCVFLIIGAAIGSVTPNLLASLTTGRNGKRTALLNLFLNLIRGAVLTLIVVLVPAVTDWIKSLSPGDVARQVANTHTIFAIFAVLVISPFAEQIVKLTKLAVPLKASEQQVLEDRRLVYIANINNKTIPAVAMGQAKLEIVRMGGIAATNLKNAVRYFFDPSQTQLFAQVEETEETVDWLNKTIEDKLVELRAMPLSDKDVFRLSRLILVVSNFERISDHAENIIEFAAKMKSAKAVISKTAMAELRTLADAVVDNLDRAMEVFEKEHFELLEMVKAGEQAIDDMQEQFIRNHIDRLMVNACDPLGGVIFTDMCTDLERCGDQAMNIAEALERS
ncbi:MAG: Na/Pi cotransporter family protein [Lachnospiraceae bacterium]|nr:Na/Pi cotransporter family protein [Lachnospiraceae bacterium]